MPNNAYSLWPVNGCQQGFRSVASFGFGLAPLKLREGAVDPPSQSYGRAGRKVLRTAKHSQTP